MDSERARYDVLSEPNPADGGLSGVYRVLATYPDGTGEVLYEGKGWEGREWAYTLAGRLEREKQQAQPPRTQESTDG